jgi:NAD+ kinase
MNRRYGIIANVFKKEARDAAQELVSLLISAGVKQCTVLEGIDVVDAQSVQQNASLLDIAASSDIVFSVGGDGTMLSAARAIMRANPSAELVGVNLGKMGFLAENPPYELPDIIQELVSGQIKREERAFIQSSVISESTPNNGVTIKRDILQSDKEGSTSDRVQLHALNEFVIDNFGSTRMLTLDISIDGAPLGTIRADGLIIATPTGSTGYALSAGGPIVEPTSPVHIITAIAPHSLTVRPLIISNTSEVIIRVTSEAATPALIVADGQEEVIVETPASITITKYSSTLHLIRRKDHSYFDLLRTKLLWSADVREHGKGRW